MRFDRVGIFEYSREKDTPSYNMKPRVTKKIAHQRFKELMKIQQKISLERNQSFIGKKIPCIIEAFSDNGEVIARSEYDAPEIDGVVSIKTKKHVVPGDIELVEIIDATEYDLIGKI